MILEDITSKESFVHRREQVQDILSRGESLPVDEATDDIMDLLRELAEQSYIAGMNRLNLTTLNASHSGMLQGYVGDDAVLVKNFLKDKGLCE